ncbi:MAG: hypothetical protein HOI95_01015 [Chromatiales bacterium]|jgi:hypothetical protein|nr:hypothetical protein [Chromatiales bacterium]
MTSSVPEISEQDATGNVASIYADIRTTMAMPLVNLIWRHLATRPPALEWAWQAARPLYAGGLASASANALCSEITLPATNIIPQSVTRCAEVSDQTREIILDLLDMYNRGNSLNLIALSTLVTRSDSIADSPVPARSEPPLTGTVPSVPSMESLTAEQREAVILMNSFGLDKPSPVIATLYRHLALWPPALALSWTTLAPLHASGALATTVNETALSASRYAATLRGELGTPGKDHHFAKSAISMFIATAISRMVPIGLILRRAFAVEESGHDG